MACCEVDSPTKYLWSGQNPVAPSVPIFTITGGVWLVSDLMPFELTWAYWCLLVLINMWLSLQLLLGDYIESLESAYYTCVHSQLHVCTHTDRHRHTHTHSSGHSIIRVLHTACNECDDVRLWLDLPQWELKVTRSHTRFKPKWRVSVSWNDKELGYNYCLFNIFVFHKWFC